MAGDHGSFFSYNLSRPYPFRWFTPVVIVGGIVLTALFSVVNVAATGYVLASKFVADPNSTLATKAWFQNPPFSYQSKLSASCQAANIATSTQLIAKSGFQYELSSVWTKDERGVLSVLPSLTYLNNSFTDCQFKGVDIHMVNYDPEGNGGYINWNRDSRATGHVTCLIENGVIPTHLNLSLTVTPFLQSSPGYRYDDWLSVIITANKQTDASRWFGQLLMFMFLDQITKQLAKVNTTTTGLITNVGIFVALNSTEPDILHDNFMSTYRNLTNIDAYYDTAGSILWYFGDQPIRELEIGDANIGGVVDYFAKSFYSFMMADLGQPPSSRTQNILSSPDILRTFWNISTTYIDNGNQRPEGTVENFGATGFDELKLTTGPIAIASASKSTLNAQYLCQIPQRKDMVSIVIAVIVADLVLLQAAWKLVTLITTFWVERKDPEAKFCAGCSGNSGTSSPPVETDRGLAKSSARVSQKSGGGGPQYENNSRRGGGR